jgi:N-acetyl sugar amidotransferase
MDTSDPEIRFDESGVCNHCHAYDVAVSTRVRTGEVGQRTVHEIVDRLKRDGAGKQYDCVIGVSGGVDSSFVAYMVKQLGLRPLAVHVDNGWDSEVSVENVDRLCHKLDIDLHTVVADWEEFRDLQVAFLRCSTPDSEIPSDHAIAASLMQTAKRAGVGHIISGYNVRTEMHLPSTWSQGHFDWRYIQSVHRRFGTQRLRTYPHLTWLDFYLRTWERFISILDCLDYSKTQAKALLERDLGWRDYGGKHYESVYTRWFQGYWLPRKFGFDKRRCHMSSLICSGEMTRSLAIEALKAPTYDPDLQEEDTASVMSKLRLTQTELEAILSLPKRTYWDYSSYGQLYRSRLYPPARRVFWAARKLRRLTGMGRGE